MRLTAFQVDQYGPLPGIGHECAEPIEVFYGPNESGKTLLLEAILRLIEPDVVDELGAIERVDHDPHGYVMVEHGGEAVKLGDGTALSDLLDLTPQDLRNVFVVRDGDVRLRDEHGFYDSVTQRIGDLHTREIDAITDELVDRGRLTPTALKLSRAAGHDDAKGVRAEAASLAEELREYVETAREAGIDDAEREWMRLAAELEDCTRELERQAAAETLDTHATLSARLETYREANDDLEGASVDPDTLAELEDLEREIDRAEANIETAIENRDEHREERRSLAEARRSIEGELAPLESRSEAVEGLEDEIEEYRERRDDAIGADWMRPVAGLLGVGALLLGGAGILAGMTLIGLAFGALGLAAFAWFFYHHRSITAVERHRQAVLTAARDAGFEVDRVSDVGPAVSAFRDRLEERRRRRDEIDAEIELAESLIEEREADLERHRKTVEDARAEKGERLEDAGVAGVREYRERVDALAATRAARERAAQSLGDALGEPATDEPDGRTEYWQAELEDLVADLPGDVSATEYDPDRLATLEDRRAELQERREELKTRLADHEERLDAFDRRIDEIDADPFLGESIRLESRSLEGLAATAAQLEGLVERIERDADVAREALDIFAELEAAEAQKMTELFGPGSRAASVFERITDGRYEGVRYDPERRELLVRRDAEDGSALTTAELSRGTTEQLYLAARLGLAEQLLGTEPGVLLLDDAFLPADSTRLREGFAVLKTLAEEGWQVLYFTAKAEIGEDCVDEFDLPCRELSRLP